MNKSFQERQRKYSEKIQSLYRKKSYLDAEEELMKFYAECADISEKKFVLSMLVGHFHYIADDIKALKFLRKAVRLFPDDVESHLSLAEHFHYHGINLPIALKHIERALDLAVINNIFIKQVLAVKIRILLKMKKYSKIREPLLMLIAYELPKGMIDVVSEGDFIGDLPKNKINEKLINQYKRLANKS